MSINIGERIKFLRQQKGYTQNDIGKMLYVSGQSVSKWEKGESSPSIETINELCKIFNISPNELLNYKDDKVITNFEYTSDKIIQSSILSFFINILLYVLGTVCIYVFDAVINIYPFNWLIGGGLWAVAIVFTLYTSINNILLFKRTNAKYKHIVYISTLIYSSIILFPLFSITLFQNIREVIILIPEGRFNFSNWFGFQGIFVLVFFILTIIYTIMLIAKKKKYAKK